MTSSGSPSSAAGSSAWLSAQPSGYTVRFSVTVSPTPTSIRSATLVDSATSPVPDGQAPSASSSGDRFGSAGTGANTWKPPLPPLRRSPNQVVTGWTAATPSSAATAWMSASAMPSVSVPGVDTTTSACA